MTERPEEEYVGTLRGYDVDILVAHPSMTCEEISDALERRPHHAFNVGEQKVLPNGRVLPQLNRDTRWRRIHRYETTDQHFADEVEDVVHSLLPYKSFFDRLRSTGGEADIIVKFLGNGYFGDTLNWDTLANMAYLGLQFGIENYMVPQNESPIAEM